LAINQKQIAQMLGVNRATISKALTDSPEISQALKEKVRALCSELGYEPNYHARSLLTNRTGVIAILKEDLRLSVLLSEWVNRIQAAAAACGYKVRLESAADIGRTMAEQSADGFISFHTPREEPDLARFLDTVDRPVVFTDCGLGHFSHNAVVVDNVTAGAKCVDHLADLGHRRVAFLGLIAGNGPCLDRWKGYAERCTQLGLNGSAEQAIPCNDWPYEIEDVFVLDKPILDAVNGGVTALVCSSDVQAVGAMKLLRRHGLSVPGDVSVTGFDDTLTARACEPDLTSVRQPVAEAARRAVEMVLDVRASGTLAQPVVLPAELVPRCSTAPPARS
jgi:DNA-binding LacI/PurR family transcriptional regulator